jgi:hypothetical protein
MEIINFSHLLNHSDSLCFPKKINLDRRKLSLPTKNSLRKIPDWLLKQAYDDTTHLLKTSKSKQATVTTYEKYLFQEIKENTRLEVIRSCWIGNFNCDMFIPSVQIQRLNGEVSLKGLVIEVNGGVHDLYINVRKDNHKYATLEDLRILPFSINNEDLKESTVKAIIRDLKKLKPIDSRAKKRLWRNIHLKTLIQHRTIIEKNNLTLPMTILESLKEGEIELDSPPRKNEVLK